MALLLQIPRLRTTRQQRVLELIRNFAYPRRLRHHDDLVNPVSQGSHEVCADLLNCALSFFESSSTSVAESSLERLVLVCWDGLPGNEEEDSSSDSVSGALVVPIFSKWTRLSDGPKGLFLIRQLNNINTDRRKSHALSINFVPASVAARANIRCGMALLPFKMLSVFREICCASGHSYLPQIFRALY
jgi:hypothetical protein